MVVLSSSARAHFEKFILERPYGHIGMPNAAHTYARTQTCGRVHRTHSWLGKNIMLFRSTIKTENGEK